MGISSPPLRFAALRGGVVPLHLPQAAGINPLRPVEMGRNPHWEKLRFSYRSAIEWDFLLRWPLLKTCLQ